MLECGPKLVANEKHLKILRQGVEAWNAWREKEHSVLPDLRGANLGGAYLIGAELRDANLRGAKLGGADLSVAKLIRAKLGRATLNEAILFGANLSSVFRCHLNEATELGSGLAKLGSRTSQKERPRL